MAEPAKKDPKRPPSSELVDIPITSFAGIDRVEQVNSVLRSLEYGNFGTPAQFVDAMLRDDRIRGDLWTRIHGLLGSPLEMKAPHGKRKARKIAELVGGSEDHPGLFPRMFPDDVLAGLMLWGLMLGVGVVEMIWDTTGEQAIPRCKLWHPQFLQWRWDTRSYWLTTQDGQVELPDTSKRPHGDGKWIVYTPFGYRYGWFHAHLRSLGMLYIDRQWVRRDWSRRNEVHGMPIRKAIVPADAEATDKDRYWKSLLNAGSEIVAVCPRNEEGKGFDVELVEAMANNTDTFKLFLDKLDSAIDIDLLGQSMSTEGVGGLGSQDKAGERVRSDYKRFDAKTLDSTLREQALWWFAAFNYADGDLAPVPVHEVDPPEDEKDEALTLQEIGAALDSLEAHGADTRELLDRFGVPLLELDDVEADPELDGEDGVVPPGGEIDPAAPGATKSPQLTPSAIGAIMSVNEARALLGLGPLTLPSGAEDPDGRLTIAEYQAKHAGVIAKVQQAEAGSADGGRDVKPAKTDDEEEAPPEIVENLRAFRRAAELERAVRGPEVIALRASASTARTVVSTRARGRAASKRAGHYATRLAAKSRVRAQRALSGYFSSIRDAVDGAKSYDDMRARLVRAFRNFDPRALEKVVARASVMAELAGRKDLLEEV